MSKLSIFEVSINEKYLFKAIHIFKSKEKQRNYIRFMSNVVRFLFYFFIFYFLILLIFPTTILLSRIKKDKYKSWVLLKTLLLSIWKVRSIPVEVVQVNGPCLWNHYSLMSPLLDLLQPLILLIIKYSYSNNMTEWTTLN